MRRLLTLALALAAAGATACSSDSPLAAGGAGGPPATLPARAFQLTIDTRSGRIDVAAPHAEPSVRAAASAVSFSLLGNDAVKMTARPCAFTPIPNNPRQKRCTFSLEIENTLEAVDLVTPTDFPRPPAGVTGVLVFPYTAASSGGSDPVAAPSPDWDRAPANFFNDLGSCSSGNKSDCYRYEVYGSPLYAGKSERRTVGFDVPIDATSVTTYIVVAADLRDNPVRFTRLDASSSLSGQVGVDGEDYSVIIGGALDGGVLEIGVTQLVPGSHLYRTFLSFRNFLPSQDVRIVSADLRVHKRSVLYATPVAEFLDYGTTLDAADYDLAPVGTGRQMFASSQDDRLHLPVHTEVQQAADQKAENIQFRLRLEVEPLGYAGLDGVEGLKQPALYIEYTLK